MEQLDLIKERKYRYVLGTRPLGAFPPNHELVGPEPDKTFVEDVRDHGLRDPVVVAVVNERIFVLDGRRRLKALRLAGYEDDFPVPISACEADSVQGAIITLRQNHLRSKNVASDLMAVNTLAAQGGMSEKEIARQAGLTLTQVKIYLRMIYMEPALLDGFLDGKIAPGVAAEIAKRPLGQQRMLAEVIGRNGKLTRADVAEVRRAGVAGGAGELGVQLEMEIPNMPKVWQTVQQGEVIYVTVPGLGKYTVATDRLIEFLSENGGDDDGEE